MKILLFLFLVCRGIWAIPLSENHFLYPREKEVLWMTAIEAPLSFSFLKRNAQDCKEGRVSSEVFKKFHCSIPNEVEKVNFFPLYDDQNFGDITFFGETHTNQHGQNYLAKVIRDSPENYFETLAMEMFNEWAQPEINELLARKASREEWRELLSKHWQYQLDGYLNIIEAAMERNLKILALDDRRKERGLHHKDDFSQDLIYRDQQMAKNLNNHLMNDFGKRIIALTGKLHSFPIISELPITVAEQVKINFPSLNTFHYLLFDIRRSTLFRSHFPNTKVPYRLRTKSSLKNFGDFYIFF